MSSVEEARLKLERESAVLTLPEAIQERVIELTKELFLKGYKDVEFIGKIADVQVCYINILNAGNASNYEDLSNDMKLLLLNESYLIEDGVICESATIQVSDTNIWGMLDQWFRTETNYFSLKGEESVQPSKQIGALINAAKSIADMTGEIEKLEFILRPTELHDNLLRALMQARGVKLTRIEINEN